MYDVYTQCTVLKKLRNKQLYLRPQTPIIENEVWSNLRLTTTWMLLSNLRHIYVFKFHSGQYLVGAPPMKTKCLYHWDLFSKLKNKNTSIGGFGLLKLDAILSWNIFVWSLPPLKIECENTTLYLTFPNQWQIYPSHPKWLKLLQLLESFWRYSLTPNPFSGFDISYVPSLHWLSTQQ